MLNLIIGLAIGAGAVTGAAIFYLWSIHKAYLCGYDDAKAGKERCCKQ